MFCLDEADEDADIDLLSALAGMSEIFWHSK